MSDYARDAYYADLAWAEDAEERFYAAAEYAFDTEENEPVTYFAHDVAAEIIARMDGYTEAEGVAFTADTIGTSIVADGGAFLVYATTPDGTEHAFRVEVAEIDPQEATEGAPLAHGKALAWEEPGDFDGPADFAEAAEAHDRAQGRA